MKIAFRLGAARLRRGQGSTGADANARNDNDDTVIASYEEWVTKQSFVITDVISIYSE
jgi:hypothetical protein